MYDVTPDPVTRPPRDADVPRDARPPRLVVPAPFLAGVARPILVALGDADHLRDRGIVPGDHLILDGDAAPEPGELVAFEARAGALLLGTYDQRLERPPGRDGIPHLAHLAVVAAGETSPPLAHTEEEWASAYVGVFRYVLPTGTRGGHPGIALAAAGDEGNAHAA